MHAIIFVNVSSGMIVGKSYHFTSRGSTPEECLSLLQKELEKVVSYTPQLTFRPVDGLIFCHDMGPVAIGILYRRGYHE